MIRSGFQKILLIKLTYSILIIFFIISVFFPYYSEISTYSIHSYKREYYGYFELIYGGWVGIGLIVLSILLLNSERATKSALLGFIGSALIIFNLVLRSFTLNLTIELWFYLAIIFLISLLIVNVFIIISREKEVIFRPISEIKKEKIKIEKPKEIDISWEKRESSKKQAFDYIKEMQSKTAELPYYDIISKTDIIRKDLDLLVKEMINNTEIFAKVRDFVILFKETPEEKKEKEVKDLKKELQYKILEADKLIKGNKLQEAIKNLIELKEIAQNNKFLNLLKIIEEKLDHCKNLQVKRVEKVKSTIFKYATRVPRLELIDISEKSAIDDEVLIEKIILDMIKNREINAEYFSSSKSIAFFQEEKPIAAPLQEGVKRLRVFLSYSTLDADLFQISDIVKNLETYPEISKVSYWQADSKENIVEFMEQTLKDCDVFVLFCSENSNKSKAVKDEWQTAFQMRKKGLLKIVPVYEDEHNIPVLLWQLLNVKFTRDDFNQFIQNLYEEILR